MAPTPLPALWRRPGWLRAPLLALIWTGLVVYGSLLPWHFDLAGSVTHAGGIWSAIGVWLTSPHWVPAVYETSSLGVPNWVSDLVLNLLLYGPLGILLRLTFSRLTGRHLVQIICAAIVVVLLSWLIEATQSLIPGRFASIQDILANSLGGIVGVLLGHTVNSLWRMFAFGFYRWTVGPRSAIGRILLVQKRRPIVMFLALCLNALLIGAWCSHMAHASQSHPGLQWMPFQWQFSRSYDVAAVLLGRSLIVYCLAGAVLMLTMMRGQTRAALGWVVLTVALTAAGVELIKLIGPSAEADVTEPLLALIAGGLVLTLGFMLVHACRCACRRHEQLPVAVDRRHRPHDYRFSLRSDNRHTSD